VLRSECRGRANVDSEKDKGRTQQHSMEQKDTGAAGQTENSKFKEGKPQQSEAARGAKGRDEVGEKHYDQGKPGQTEATQEQNTPKPTNTALSWLLESVQRGSPLKVTFSFAEPVLIQR
jgi:hypothetical protein